jgi:negative regulator of flagellin synthesis FlgM
MDYQKVVFMSINKINSVNGINEYAKMNSASQARKTDIKDTVSISNEALSRSEQKRIIEMVKSAPDVRADRIAEVKAKLAANPNYFDDVNVVSKTADIFINELM